MKIQIVGTSAAVPSAGRSHISFVLWTEQPYLVECGPTVPWQLARLGIDHRDISDVFLSHVHGDHSLGLPMLFTMGALEERSWPLRVYCPESAVERLKTICLACYPSQDRLIEEKIVWNGLPETTS